MLFDEFDAPPYAPTPGGGSRPPIRDARRGQASEPPGQDPDYDHFDQMLEGIAQVGLGPQQGAQQQQGEPMFGLEKVPYQPKGLKQMVVCNDVVAMALSNGHIIRLRLDAPDDLEDIEFARRKEDQIHSIFLDPTGNSLIISMENKENWYLHASWKKPRPLSKMKGLLIESVAWDTNNKDPSNTGEILIGSRDGRIFETAVEAKDKLFVEGKEKYFKPIYALGEDQPVLGLRYERFPPSRVEGPKFFVMAATGTRLYQFIGGPTFEAVFGSYERNPAFLELPGEQQAGRGAESNVSFFSKYQGVAKSFAWLTGPGIYHGSLVFGSQNPGDSVMADTQLLPYPWCDEARQRRLGSPLSLVLSEFHFLLLYEDRFVAVSQLDNTVAHEESLGRGSRGSRMRGLVLDPTKAALWAYAEDAIYQLFAADEDRHVWRKYLEKGLFEEALRYCKLPAQRDQVLLGQAEYYLQAKRYESAARAFAKTTAPFEEVALRFIALGEKDALKAFLTTRLALLPPHALMQRTALAAWIVEQHLARLNQLREARLHDQHAMLLDELRGFLKEQREDLERARPTINQLLWSHGHPDLARYFAAAVGDDARVLRDLVRGGEWANALEVLARANSGELYYQFSPTLMAHVPRPTVDAWISSRTPLQPRKLLPALMRYQPSPAQGPNESIRYLEHCIQKGNQDPAIHNYLLSLYAQQGSEEALLGFLQREEAVFDLRYALRLALRHEKRRACVDIYSAMGLHEEAVDLAIRLDVNLAKAHANRPQDDEVRKKLWLRIARHVVEEDQDIKKAMAFLKDCELLKIEDILPFFPDFVLIDDFKEEICGSLEEYNRHIEDLKHEMDDATHSADLIRLDIKQLRSKCGFVAGNQKCDLCAYPVLSRQFYLFPCQHTFHADCLAREITRHLTDAQRLRLRELQLLVAEHSRAPAPRPKSSSAPAPAGDAPAAAAAKLDVDLLAPIQTEQLKNELDDLVASQCITCGKLTIDSITRPFIDVRDQDLVKSWFI